MAPEFFFHGKQGPYVHSYTWDDPADAILKELAEVFPEEQYPNWTFVCGTVITTRVDSVERVFESKASSIRNGVVKALAKAWQEAHGPLKEVIFDQLVNFIKNCHCYPCMEVRNRALIVSNIPLDSPLKALDAKTMTTEKYFFSNEDLLLYDVHGRKDVITEQMTSYPPIDLTGGDIKLSPKDNHAIFRQNYGSNNVVPYLDMAVEICLDHKDVRLRSNTDNQPFLKNTDKLHLQLIPSCGMQLKLESIAVDDHGYVFNCDGQYGLDKSKGVPQKDIIDNVACVFTNYVCPTNSVYASHTQLARVRTPTKKGDPMHVDAAHATFDETLGTQDVTVVPVVPLPDLHHLYAGGPGALHIYGLKEPYPLYS